MIIKNKKAVMVGISYLIFGWLWIFIGLYVPNGGYIIGALSLSIIFFVGGMGLYQEQMNSKLNLDGENE